MKHHLLPLCCLLLLPLNAFAQGSLNPPGAPAPTMKSLDQLDGKLDQATSKVEEVNAKAEKRIPISSVPFTITAPGSYYLTGNLTHDAASNGITINANEVTIDLNGFTLASSVLGGSAIFHPSGGLANGRITVRNGFVRGWTVGVRLEGNNYRVEGVTASNNGTGIECGSACAVVDCVAAANTSRGISLTGSSGVVLRSVAARNGGDGFVVGVGATVQQCAATSNGDDGIAVGGQGSLVSQCTASFNRGDGIQVQFDTVVVGNSCSANGFGADDGAGIHAVSTDNRIEGNNVSVNDRGIDVDGARNLIIKNSAAANTTNYAIVANNVFGAIIDRTAPASGAVTGNAAASSAGTTDPWANFSY